MEVLALGRSDESVMFFNIGLFAATGLCQIVILLYPVSEAFQVVRPFLHGKIGSQGFA